MQSLEEYLRSGANQEIITKRNNPAKWIVFVIVGIMLLLYGYEYPMSDSLQMILLVGGFTLAAVGLVMSIVASQGIHFVFVPDGSAMKEYERYVADGERAPLQEMLTTQNLETLESRKPRVTSNTLLKAFQTSDGQVVAVQLMAYEGSALNPLTEPVVLKGEQAIHVSSFLKNKAEQL